MILSAGLRGVDVLIYRVGLYLSILQIFIEDCISFLGLL